MIRRLVHDPKVERVLAHAQPFDHRAVGASHPQRPPSRRDLGARRTQILGQFVGIQIAGADGRTHSLRVFARCEDAPILDRTVRRGPRTELHALPGEHLPGDSDRLIPTSRLQVLAEQHNILPVLLSPAPQRHRQPVAGRGVRHRQVGIARRLVLPPRLAGICQGVPPHRSARPRCDAAARRLENRHRTTTYANHMHFKLVHTRN